MILITQTKLNLRKSNNKYMEKKFNNIHSKSLSNSQLLATRAAQQKEYHQLVLPALPNSKLRSFVNPSKSTNISPAQRLRRVYSKSKHLTKVFTQWEVFNANREPKYNQAPRHLHGLRRGIKNPHIYVDNLETEENQKAVVTGLEHAFFRIHGN